MKRNLSLIVTLVLLGGMLTSNAWADLAVGIENLTDFTMQSQGSRAYGWKFTLNNDIVVTDILFYDDVLKTCTYCTDGFDWSYDIGLFAAGQTDPLAQTTVSVGEELSQSGLYRLKSIDDLLLSQYNTLGDPESGLAEYWMVYVPHVRNNVFDLHMNKVSTYEMGGAVNYLTSGHNEPIAPVTERYDGVLRIPNWETTEYQYFSINFMYTEVPSSLTVEIDIKPDSETNSINLGSNGLIPVAILSTEDFDATTVDVDSIELAGSGVAVRGKGNKYLANTCDVNGDGLLDLVAHVETENLDPDNFQDGQARLTATTADGIDIEGWDFIQIVPE